MVSLWSRDGSSLLLAKFVGIHDITSNEVQNAIIQLFRHSEVCKKIYKSSCQRYMRLKAYAWDETVTKNGVQFFCMNTAQYNTKIDKLKWARNKFALFSHLFISCQIKKHGVFIRTWESSTRKKNSGLIGCIRQKDFTSPNEGPNISTKNI